MARTSPQPNVHSRPAHGDFSARFWLLVVLTGIGAGVSGGLLMKLLYAIEHAAWFFQTGSFLDAVKQCSPTHHVLVLLGAGLIAGIGQRLLFNLNGGRGSELSERIWFHSGKFATLSALARSVLSIVIVGMGASLGREGALKQTGAVIGSRLATWTRLSASEMRLLAAYGAGAGMAAAYNVPFGGALFALEVLLGDLALPLVLPALAASGLATAVSWLMLPDQPTYAVHAHSLSIPLLVWSFIAGPLFGFTAVFYVRVIAWAEARKPHGWRVVVASPLAFTALGIISIAYPHLLGNGLDVVQLAFSNRLDLSLLVTLPLLKLLATASNLQSGAPGGLFTPTLAFGALLGGLFGYGWVAIWPDSSHGSYALIGAGAVLAAATQGPISSVVLLLELTWWIDPLMVPLLIAVSGAMVVARQFESRSIDSVRVHAGEMATVVQQTAAMNLDELFSTHAEVVSSATRYSDLARRLLTLANHASPLYVVDERDRVVGVITADRALWANNLPLPLEATTAADLAMPVPTIRSSSSKAEVIQQLNESKLSQLPVVDADTEQFVGIVALNLGTDAPHGD